MSGFKYELGSKVTTKEEIPFLFETFEGDEGEGVIPAGTTGEVSSCGRDSRYGFTEMYYVTFTLENEREEEVAFLVRDLEKTCEIEPFEEGAES